MTPAVNVYADEILVKSPVVLILKIGPGGMGESNSLNAVPYKLPSAPSNRFDSGVPSNTTAVASRRNVWRVVRAPSASIANTVPIVTRNGDALAVLVVP